MESHVLDTSLRWIVLVPLLGAALNGLLLRRMPRRAAGLLACAAAGASFLLSVAAVVRLAGLEPHHRLLADSLGTWLDVAGVRVELGFAMDQLSAVMALVVTGVGFLIHVYSLGYMAHDPGFNRFFTYLNLFIFAMMMLVLGENLVMLFVGWEGVGLCSYLLISFWFNEEANAAAGKKAFIVNRVGDFGFLLGMFVLGAALLPHLGGGEGVFSFRTIAAHTHDLAPWATAIGLLMFLGATGKSAQIPLYIWLPDAMAGPTPVSALIHAATMVTAGVYMIARMNMVYVLSPAAMTVVAVTGAATALFAATIALTQNDIKKVLAYSTVSQLGYMMLACGVGAFAAGIFHVMTHAFFKALLFLGAGSVIHAMSGEQDLRLMGGLRRKLPVTWPTFLIGTVALAGVFPFAGFFSKDEILWKAFSDGNLGLWLVGFLGAGLTAFYMMRLVVLAFFGNNRASEAVRHHVHESPATMTAPLAILAVLSVAGGWLGWPHFLGGSNRFEQWLAPVFEHEAVEPVGAVHGAATHAAASTEWLLAAASLSLALLGLYAGYRAYAGRATLAAKLHAFAGGKPHRLLLNKYYVDEGYEASLVRPGYALSDRVLFRAVDTGLIDGLLVNGSALLVSITSALLRLFQNGKLRFYAYVFALGAAAFVLYLALTI